MKFEIHDDLISEKNQKFPQLTVEQIQKHKEFFKKLVKDGRMAVLSLDHDGKVINVEP